jgi:hypothetical protein
MSRRPLDTEQIEVAVIAALAVVCGICAAIALAWLA